MMPGSHDHPAERPLRTIERRPVRTRDTIAAHALVIAACLGALWLASHGFLDLVAAVTVVVLGVLALAIWLMWPAHKKAMSGT
jgi:hypothetical protein